MGIQINGATDSITAIDGTIDVVSAIGNAGVLTATAFVGNITGNVTGNINHTSNLELQTGGVTRAHFNSSGHFGIAGISTFSNDVKFTGNNYNVLWDKSDNSLKFDTLAKIKLADQFEFYHSTNGVLHNKSGITFIYGSGSGNISIQAQTGAQNIACSPNGGTSLYYQGDQKLYTVSDGVYLNDNLGIQDSIQHILDTNTKIRFPANDTVTVETAGSERLRIGSNGSVGIGTDYLSTNATTYHKLMVEGDTTSTIAVAKIVRKNSNASNGTYTFEVDSSVHGSNMSSGGAMAVDVYSGRAFTIDGNAKIGIGTDTPVSQLNLKLSSRTSGFRITDSGTSADCLRAGAQSDGDGFLQLRTTSGSGPVLFDASGISYITGGNFVVGGSSAQTSDAVTLMTDGEVTAAGFYFSNNIGSAMNACGIRRHTTNTMVFDTASTERLRIDADGNTSTKGSAMEHFVNKKVQSINSNGNSVQYVLVAPTGTNNLRLQGKFHFTRATGTSGIAQQTVDAQIMTNNTGGDAQYYVRTATTDQGSYAGIYYRWVTCDYNSTTYYALEGHPTTGSSYWGGFMQHGVYTGTANACTNLGTVLNTTSHSISNITALTTRKAHERWYNTFLNVQSGGLYVKQASDVTGAHFAPTFYDTNGASLPTQMKVHGQKAVCIDCTRYYTSGDIITFRINNDYEGAIYVNPSGVQYNTTSDYRLKENVINLTGAIDRVKQLKPKRFNFIKDPGNTIDGFMAHEVSSVVPNAVVGEKDAVKDILYEENDEVIPEGKKVGDVKEKDAIDPQSMDDSKLVPLLTAALQEAIAKIETLETKVAALEG